MSSFVHDSEKLFLGRYKGSILEHAWISIIALLTLIALEALFWFIFREQIWFEGWISFWHSSDLKLTGLLIIITVISLPWVIFPNIIYFSGRSSYGGYITYPTGEMVKWILLILTNVISSFLILLIGPAVAIYLLNAGIRSWIFFLIGGIPGASIITQLFRYIKMLSRRRQLGKPNLVSFRSKLRPINLKFINLDVGALAPRLNVVSSALASWSRVADGSAPTAKLYWDTISGSRSKLPKAWSRNLRNLAFTNIEEFRRNVAELVYTDTGSVCFVTSTTRAVDLVLSSLEMFDCIITTSLEHPSARFVMKNHTLRSGIPIEEIDLSNAFENKTFDLYIVNEVLKLAARYSCPIVFLSEVPYSFGIKLPVAEISKKVREKFPNAILIFDGAHAVGQFDVNLGSRDFDFYLFSGHKWLFGPASLGILVLGERVNGNQSLMARIRSEAFESLAFIGSKLGEAGSTISLDPFVGLAEVVKYMDHGRRMKMFRNLIAIRMQIEMMADKSSSYKIVRYPALNGDNTAPGLLNVQRANDLSYDGYVNIRDFLEVEKGVITKVVERPLSLRLCVPFYLEQYEIERLSGALEDAFTSGPMFQSR